LAFGPVFGGVVLQVGILRNLSFGAGFARRPGIIW
jgi:hypothetical protein